VCKKAAIDFLFTPISVLCIASPMNVDLKEYVADGARRITPAHLDKLVRWLPEIRLAMTQVTEFPNLPDQVEFLVEIVEDFHSGLNRSIPFMAIAEAAFALFYLRKGVDIIPDGIPGSGFADDAAVVAVVFERYKEPFLKHMLARNARKPIDQE
jgi:uncharacterized membrane protein YkvA (DUF1232 family)